LLFDSVFITIISRLFVYVLKRQKRTGERDEIPKVREAVLAGFGIEFRGNATAYIE
jgi:hypothetical protein